MLITAEMLLRYVNTFTIGTAARVTLCFLLAHGPPIRFQFWPSEEQCLSTVALKYTNGDTGMC